MGQQYHSHTTHLAYTAIMDYYGNEGADNQLWYIDDHTQTIRSKLNDFCIDLDGEGRCVLNPYDPGAESQMWTISGPKIENMSQPGKVLDIYDKDSWDGAKVVVYDYSGDDNQHWALEATP